jgi:hypothetical protein
MARITETPLFKAIAPKIKSITRKQLAKELAIVKKSGQHMSEIAIDIASSFTWDETPQGWQFWNALNRETLR